MIEVMIPARGNSKGIKNKNIVKINKKELICYTINFSKKLKSVSKVIVSTDAQRILKIAKKNGAHVPFIRPAKFAKDYSSDLDVFTHYINWLKKNEFPLPEKSACICCPFHDDKYWDFMKKERPSEFADAVEFDKEIRTISRNKNIKNYTHKSCKPLDEVEFSKEDNQLDMFENECEGMCGL